MTRTKRARLLHLSQTDSNQCLSYDRNNKPPYPRGLKVCSRQDHGLPGSVVTRVHLNTPFPLPAELRLYCNLF